MAREKNKELWQSKLDIYEKHGMSSSDDKEKVDMKFKNEDLKEFMRYYVKLVSYLVRLRRGRLHWDITESIDNDYVEDDMDREKVIRLTLGKYKHQFEEYLESLSDHEDDDIRLTTTLACRYIYLQ